jgi:hypothetical protein
MRHMGEAVGSFYRWQAPGKTVAVSLSLAVVERLGSIIRQEGGPSHRRAEIGGFLLGTVGRNRGVTTVEVDGFEPVECEHAFGESYFLSGDEQRRLAERLHGRRPKGSGSIVGFFRSNTRKEFSLTIEDLDLMAAHFSKPSMVLLLVHAEADGSLTGGFSIWEQRAIRTMKPYLEFPFETRALLAGSDTICKQGSERSGGNEQSSTALVRSPRGGNWAPLPGAALALLRRPRGSASGGGTPAVRTEQAFPQFVALSTGRLGTTGLLAVAGLAIAVFGSALYRAVRPPESPAATLKAQSNVSREYAKPDPWQVKAEVADAAVAVTPLIEAPPVVTPPLRAAVPTAPVESTTDRNREAWRASSLPIATPAADAAPALPAAPDVAMEVPRPAEPLAAESGILTSSLPKVPDPFVTFAVEPLPSSHRGFLGRLGAHKDARKATAFVPPRLVDQRLPNVPEDLRRRIRDGVVPITVKLYLGKSGAVDYAELLSDGTGANRALATLAVFESRKFQFSPARDGGEAVPAEVLVRFRFGSIANR